jgi:hypothetical protein
MPTAHRCPSGLPTPADRPAVRALSVYLLRHYLVTGGRDRIDASIPVES